MQKQVDITKEEFIVFILILASNEDMIMSPDEISKIQELYGIKTYEKMLGHFDQLSEFQRIKWVMDQGPTYVKDKKDRDDILKLLEEVFMADGDFSSIEKGLFNFLEHLFLQTITT